MHTMYNINAFTAILADASFGSQAMLTFAVYRVRDKCVR